MSSSNRIPAGSVSFSNKSYVMDLEKLQLPTLKSEMDIEIENEQEKRMREFQEKEKELAEKESELNEVIKEIENRYGMLQQAQEEFDEKMKSEIAQYEREKLNQYYLMREFLWDQSLKIAEYVLNQKINLDDFSMTDMFTGILKKLPVQMDELKVTAHPETVELIKQETKKSWILQDLEWKKDYSLEIGDFIIEDQYELFDCRVKTILEEIAGQIKQKNREIRGAGDELED